MKWYAQYGKNMKLSSGSKPLAMTKQKILGNSFLFFGLLVLFFPLGGCQYLRTNEPSAREKTVDLLTLNLTLVKGGVARIPVKLSQSPSTPVTVEYSLKDIDGKQLENFKEGQDYTIEPHSLTFSPGQTTDTITLTNISDQSKAIDAALFLEKASNGYKVGTINFSSIHLFGGNSFLLTFDRLSQSLDMWHGVTPIVNLGTSNGNAKAPFEITYGYEVDKSKSTAVEGIHFALPEDHEGMFQVGARQSSFNVSTLKYEEGKDIIVLKLIPKTGFSLDKIPSISIRMLKPVDYSGRWKFVEFQNKRDFLDYGNEKPETIIDGEEGDYMEIKGNPTNISIDWHLSGRLRHLFPATCRGYHLRDLEYKSFFVQDGLPMMNVYVLDKFNSKVSANYTLIRPSQVGFVYAKRQQEEYLALVIYDMDPVDTFKGMYDIMADGSEFPMLTWPALYVFKKVK